ncbi:MAG: hypothetical protein QXH71_01240 [Candidatus Anstonellaceae archaeon]
MPNWFSKLLKIKKYPKTIKIKKEVFVIPSPLIIKKLMKKPKKGKLITTEQIFNYFSNKHKKTKLYLKAIEIFIWGWANNYSTEDFKKAKFPFWRTINKDGSLISDFPGGQHLQASFLRKEGHIIIRKGKNLFVKNFLKKLIKL